MFSSEHNFKIKQLDGEIIDLYEAGVMVLGFDDPIPELTYFEETAEGIEGYIDMGAEYQGRTPSARFYIEARDYIAWSLELQKVYRLFKSYEPFYIIRDVQPGKRLLVRRAGGFLPALEPGYAGEFAISFKSPSPYWESIADTSEPIDFNSHLWAIGMGFETDKHYQYKFTGSSFAGINFTVHNPGDADLDPRKFNRRLKMIIKGSFQTLQLTNETTGESFRYTGGLQEGEELVIDGVKVLKNGMSVFSNTNRAFISLKKGENHIMLRGVTNPGYSVEIVTKFYYL